MSGGVDSSVAAYLLKERGYDVIGLFMRNWHEEPCPAVLDYEDALAVCETLQIPLYSTDFSKEYWDKVFSICLDLFKKGMTPNPDILCNKEIKFNLFFKKALSLGADFIATGHYCRILKKEGVSYLARGKDPQKDQSYFLYAINPKVLDRVLFPIGDFYKKEIRKIAEEQQLITADKKDSTGICFIGKRDFRSFLSQFITPKKGKIFTIDGEEIGSHEGVAYYTIGQRRGLDLGGAKRPYFVVAKDTEKNILFVCHEDHPALYHNCFSILNPDWLTSPKEGFEYTAKIRYRSKDEQCHLIFSEDQIQVKFIQPQKAVTSGQAIVFYDQEICIGGGMILV